jgi:hypothetical protein
MPHAGSVLEAPLVMSALGQKQTFRCASGMSALLPKADIAGRQLDVRFVPIADMRPLIQSPRQR